MHDLASTVVLLGVLQGAVLAAVLWTRRANRLANRLLAALVAAVALMLALGELQSRYAFHGYPQLLAVSTPLPFLFGPLLYLYVVALTRPAERFDPGWAVHALPFAGDVLYMAQGFYLKAPDEKIAIARASDVGQVALSFHVVGFLEVVVALAYLALAWRALEQYGLKMRGYFSDLAGIDLRWLKGLVVAHAVVWCVVLGATVLRAMHQPNALGLAVGVGSSLAIFLTGYISVWQPEVAQKARAASHPSEDPGLAESLIVSPRPVQKYQRNRLDDGEARELVAKLEAMMGQRRMYRDAALTLGALADALGTTPHALSQVLNVHVGKSFFVFVNGYRAEALMEALADPSRAGRGVLDLAFEVGFASKSTLNAFFKRHTGTTPTAYRARARATTIAAKSSA
jgi:AraC-like DNA-binding protein